MKILHVTPSYWPAVVYGGPTISITRLCENQALLKHDVCVMTTTANGKEDLPYKNGEVIINNGVSVKYFSRITGDHSNFSPILLWNLFFRCRQFDVIHIHSWWNLVVIPAVLICRMRGVRPVFSPRGMLSQYSTKGKTRGIFHKTVGRALLKNTILHTTSKQEQSECISYISNWKGFLLPNIVDLPPTPVIDKDTIINTSIKEPYHILYIGRLHPIKRLELVFEALSYIKHNWKLTIAGEGAANYVLFLKNLAHKYKINDRLSWYGWANNATKLQLLQQTDLLILTSFSENFANTILEGLSLGIPVLLTKGVGLSDYVEENQFGWICEPDPQDISTTIEKLITKELALPHNPADIAKRVHEEFNSIGLAHKYIYFYQHIN